MLQTLMEDSLVALPMLSWAILGIFLLVAQIIVPCSKLSLSLCILGVLSIIGVSFLRFNQDFSYEIFFGSAIIDSLSQIVNLVTGFTVLGVILMMAPGIFKNEKIVKESYEQLPEFLICLVFSAFGVCVLGSSMDLTTTFLGLETLSIALYAMCGFYRGNMASTESAFKYLLIGAFATVIFLYGVSFIYGATGSTQYTAIAQAIQLGPISLVTLGGIFLVAGFAFKLALVPFHLYTPDVYEGAPTPVTAYLATIVKLAAAAGALRLFAGVLSEVLFAWESFWLALCILSVLIGNIAALQQKSLKKLFAFSSISHAGYIGFAVLFGQEAMFPLLSYVIVYIGMTLGLFALLTWIEDREKPLFVDDLKGLGHKSPWIGVFFSIFLFGMAGIPPFAGFIVKFWILQGLVEKGFIWGAFFGVVGSLIGAAYYLKLMVYIFMSPEEERSIGAWPLGLDRLYSLRLVVAAALIITLFAGIRPQWSPLGGLEFLLGRDKIVWLDGRF